MKKQVYLCIIAVGLLLFSCLLDGYDKRLGNTNYYVGWGDMVELTKVSQGYGYRSGYQGLTGTCITDVYWNDRYILAARCQRVDGVDNYLDSIADYSIITMLPYRPAQGVSYKVECRLSRQEYEQRKAELSLREEDMEYFNLFKQEYRWWKLLANNFELIE